MKKWQAYRLSSLTSNVFFSFPLFLLYYVHLLPQSKSPRLAQLQLGGLKMHKTVWRWGLPNCQTVWVHFELKMPQTYLKLQFPSYLDCYHLCIYSLWTIRNTTPQWVIFDSLKIWLFRIHLGLGNETYHQGLGSLKNGTSRSCYGLEGWMPCLVSVLRV